MALINPCDIEAGSVSNTGVECDSALNVAKGIAIMPPGYTWTREEMSDVFAFFQKRRHAPPSERFYYVLQGIFDFTLATESDVSETNNISGVISRLRPGGFTLTYIFEKGGQCLAKALLGFQGKGYRFIIFDDRNQVLVGENSDGRLRGLKSSEISSSITPATASAKYKNILTLGVSQEEYIKNSVLLKLDHDVSDFEGLVDVTVKPQISTSTALNVTLSTCGGTDLVSKFGSTLADLDNFIVKKNGAVVNPTAIGISFSTVFFSGNWGPGQYTIQMAPPLALFANNIIGYESNIATIGL